MSNVTDVDRPVIHIAGCDIPVDLLAAYTMMMVAAIGSIYVGSKSSLVSLLDSETEVESMTSKDAMMFPVYGSGALFSLYMLVKMFGKEYMNMLLTVYFSVAGIVAVQLGTRGLLVLVLPQSVLDRITKRRFTGAITTQEGKDGASSTIFELTVDTLDFVCLAIAIVFCAAYAYTKHWVANNVLGVLFSVAAIEQLHVGSLFNASVLLCGLFLYDIFWVFGTEVMVTVAKSFDAPIKLLFPKDILVNGWNATQFSMLGLGDIVIPGLLVALMLRYDYARGLKNSRLVGKKTYFWVCMVGYFVGLLTTLLVMHAFGAAQPALLYLVPTCLGSVLIVGLLSGNLKDMFAYRDDPASENDKKSEPASPSAVASSSAAIPSASDSVRRRTRKDD